MLPLAGHQIRPAVQSGREFPHSIIYMGNPGALSSHCLEFWSVRVVFLERQLCIAPIIGRC